MSRLPQSWPGRVLWLMIAIAACWIAYRFGVKYAECRANSIGKVGCVFDSMTTTYFEVVVHAVSAATKILAFVLP